LEVSLIAGVKEGELTSLRQREPLKVSEQWSGNKFPERVFYKNNVM
jgi:hypothetical protein